MSLDDARNSIFEDEKEKPENLQTFLQTKGVEMFISNIPIAYFRTLPSRKLVLSMGFFSYLVMAVAFLYFLVSGYMTAVNEKFITLDESSGECLLVKRPITGNYMADVNGNWQGSSDFKYSQGLYDFKFFNLYASDGELEDTLTAIGKALEGLGEIGKSHPLSYNLLLLMSFKRIFKINPEDKNDQLFSFTAMPHYIFNRQYGVIDLSTSGKLNCSAAGEFDYDVSTAILTATYSAIEYEGAGCEFIIPMEELGYDEDRDGDSLKVRMDLRTHVLAVSVNMGILDPPLYGLESVPLPPLWREDFGGLYSTEYDGFILSAYVDPQNPGMDPLACFQLIDQLNLGIRCTVVLDGGSLGIPTISEWEEDCTFCSDWMDPYCEIFDIVISVIVMEGMDALQLFKHYSPNTLNELAFYASPMTSVYNTNDAFDFCNHSCSVISVNLYDMMDQRVNEQFYSLISGACSDSFTTPHWGKLASSAPESLTETYFECHKSWDAAFLDATGIAAGNTTTFVPLLLFFLIPVTYLYLNFAGLAVPKERYDDDAKMVALMELASHLLRIKDMDASGFPADSTVVRLAEELMDYSYRDRRKRSRNRKKPAQTVSTPLHQQTASSDIELADVSKNIAFNFSSSSSNSKRKQPSHDSDDSDDEEVEGTVKNKTIN